MLQPARRKYRKEQKGRNKGLATRGASVSFGEFGLKATGRGRLTARQIEQHLQSWLSEYQVDNPDTGSSLLLKRPLRGVRANVRSDPENLGRLLVDIWLQPHSQFSGATANLHLVASVNDSSRRGGTGGRT